MKHRRRVRFSFLSSVLLATVIAVPGLAMPSTTPAFKAWDQVQKQGAEAFALNQYGNAERLLRDATMQARLLEPGDVRLAKSSGELGRLLTIRGRFAEAEPFLEEELRLKEVAMGYEDGKIIQSMGDMVRFYLTYGTTSKAYPMTRKVLFFVEGKLREESEEREKAAAREKGGPLIGWAGTAAPVMITPLLEWAITCDLLGDLYRDRKQYDLADRLYKAALDIKTTILGKHHLSLAVSYDRIGSICQARKEYDEAETYFRDALSVTQSIVSADNPIVYFRLDKLGRCLALEGKYDDAEQLYRGTAKWWQIDPTRGGNESRALYQLGCLYCDQKKYSSAAPVLARALRVAEQNSGNYSIELVPYLKKYAYVMYNLGRRGDAAALNGRADFIAPPVKPIAPAIKMEALVLEPEKKDDKEADGKGKGKGKAKGKDGKDKTAVSGSKDIPAATSTKDKTAATSTKDKTAATSTKDKAAATNTKNKTAAAGTKEKAAVNESKEKSPVSDSTEKAVVSGSTEKAPVSDGTDAAVSTSRELSPVSEGSKPEPQATEQPSQPMPGGEGDH